MEMAKEILNFVIKYGIPLVVLLSFVFNFTKKNPKEKDSTNRMPDFGGHTNSREKKYGQYEDNESDDADEQMERKRTYGNEWHPSPVPVRASNISLENAGAGSTSRVVTTNGASREKCDRLDYPLGPDEAMRGVVWAEILGPPRARRPFGQRQS